MKDNKISFKIYNNQDSFPFETLGMPLFNNSIPFKIFYSPMDSEILCLASNNSDHLSFITLVNKLLNRMSKQGSQKRGIKILLNKTYICSPF